MFCAPYRLSLDFNVGMILVNISEVMINVKIILSCVETGSDIFALSVS